MTQSEGIISPSPHWQAWNSPEVPDDVSVRPKSKDIFRQQKPPKALTGENSSPTVILPGPDVLLPGQAPT